MTQLEVIKKSAAASADMIEALTELVGAYDTALTDAHAKLNTLRKAASAPAPAPEPVVKAVELDEQLLQKTAAALDALYGSNIQNGAEVISSVFKKDPNRMLQSLYKMASDRASMVVAGDALGTPVMQKAAGESRTGVIESLTQHEGDIPSHKSAFLATWGGSR